MKYRKLLYVVLLAGSVFAPVDRSVRAAGKTYYVSTSDGNDSFDGESELTPFETIGKVNTLNLQPGDQVLFKCGDTWRAEQLVVSKSGTEIDPIVFGSYPVDCMDKPVLSGSQPIAGWTAYAGAIYRANLSAGDNAGKFPLGINQLFRDGQRLALGRWPNLGTANGGYSVVDGQPAGNQIADNELPGADWTGAAIHIKTMRWLLVNREVTGSAGNTLTLNDDLSCWGGTCQGWGYFINSHLETLDQDGEWYWDEGSNQVYLYSAGGLPGDVEGSVIQETGPTLQHGGIVLGTSSTPIAYVVIDNLAIENWFNRGISVPGGMSGNNHHVTIRDNLIKDVDAAGVRLSTWIGAEAGLFGGHHFEFTNNVIDGANHFGITGFFHTTLIQDNEIKNIGLVENLGRSGLGCGFTGASCTEYGDGIRIRRFEDKDTGHSNVVQYNRLEKVAYNGMDVFGPNNTIEYNFIKQACYTKGDCGGVRTFGGPDLSTTRVHDVRLSNNIIVDIPGNTDGCNDTYSPPFGMGLYIDYYSRDVEITGNTVVSTTFTGILYQRSTGEARGNIVYNASSGTMYAGLVSLVASETRVTLEDNVLYGLTANAWTLYSYSLDNFLASDYNYLFHPYEEDQIAHGPSWTRYTFSEWKAYSGLEGHSKTNWFTLEGGDPPLSRIFYNDTKSVAAIDLGTRKYLDLDQNDVTGSVTLQPFTSIVLIDNGEVEFTLQGMSPVMWGVDEAADFTLAVDGTGFTENSVVRWGGSDRTTGFVSSSALTATIYATDVDTVAEVPVTVYDPAASPTETPPLTFYVVESVSRVYLPIVSR